MRILLYVLTVIGAVTAAVFLASSVGVGHLRVYYGAQPLECRFVAEQVRT